MKKEGVYMNLKIPTHYYHVQKKKMVKQERERFFYKLIHEYLTIDNPEFAQQYIRTIYLKNISMSDKRKEHYIKKMRFSLYKQVKIFNIMYPTFSKKVDTFLEIFRVSLAPILVIYIFIF